MSFLADLALSVIPALFQNKPKAPGVDYAKLRRDAEAAGFNPLTALMAGGGAGYQRDFNPAMSSGQFIAEAVVRGLDTAFNAPVQNDPAADQIRRRVADRDRQQALMQSRPPGGFGYDLTDVQVAPAPASFGPPALHPKGNPLYPHNREQIVVLNPSGTPVKLDASLARRYDIQPMDMLSVGDMEELQGGALAEAGAVTNALGGWFGLAKPVGEVGGFRDTEITPPPVYAPKPPKFGVPFGQFGKGKKDPSKWWWQ